MSDVYEFSEGFQAKILALMARDKGTYVAYQDVLKPKYFRKATHIDLARIIHEYYETEMQRAKVKGTEINAPTIEVLFEEVRKLTKNSQLKAKIKTQYEDEIIDIMQVDLSDAGYITDNIITFGRRSALTHAILESVDEIEKGVEDFSSIEDKISKAIRVGEDVSDLGVDYFENAETRMTDIEKGTDGVRRVPTGLSGVDKLLNGGLGDGELGVIIAPPNRGKLAKVA